MSFPSGRLQVDARRQAVGRRRGGNRMPALLLAPQVGLQDVVAHLGGWPVQLHAPVAEQARVVGKAQGALDELLDEQQRDARFAELAQGVVDAVDQLRSETQRRLVDDQDARLTGEHPGLPFTSWNDTRVTAGAAPYGTERPRTSNSGTCSLTTMTSPTLTSR